MQRTLGRKKKTDYLGQGKLLVKLTLVFYELLKRTTFVVKIMFVKLFRRRWHRNIGFA